MELLQLRYFCAAAELENMSKAAAFYHIPQSAMSKTVSKLEQELGYKLFDRIGNRIFLNATGAGFYESVQTAINAIDRAVGQVSASDGKNSLAIAAISSAVSPSAYIRDFKRKYPDVNFIIYNELQADADLILSTGTNLQNVYRKIGAFQKKIWLALPKKHSLAGLAQIRLEDLSNMDFVLCRQHCDVHEEAYKFLLKHKIKYRTPYICENMDQCLSFVKEGNCATFLTDDFYSPHNGQAALFNVSGMDIHLTVGIYIPPGKYMGGPAKEFADRLMKKTQS